MILGGPSGGEAAAVLRSGTVTIVFDARLIARVVAGCAALVWTLGVAREIVALSSGADVGWLFIGLDAEGNLPAWFSSLLLFAGGLSAAVTALLSRRAGAKGTLGWLALSLIFTFMAADEATVLHESTMPLMWSMASWTGPFLWPWVVWALPLVAVVGAAFIPFLLRLHRPTALRLVAAGTVYLTGALGMEMIGAIVFSTPALGIPYAVPFCIEEGLEMSGAVLFLRAVLLHISETIPRVVLEAFTGKG